MNDQPRVPAGDPSGGQFAGRARAETGTTLDDHGGLVGAEHRAGVAAHVFTDEEGTLVVAIDTAGLPDGSRVRVVMNDGDLFDGDPEVDEPLHAGGRQPWLDPVRARREATIRDFIDSADLGDAAASWRVDVLASRDGHRMSQFVEVLDGDGNELALLDTARSREAQAAVDALLTYVAPEVQDGYVGAIPRIAPPPE